MAIGRTGSWMLSALLLPWLAAAATADVGAYRCVDPGKTYHGNPKLFQRPCVVSADRVYAAIPEYREILEKGLTPKDVRYHFLMKKASERFVKAVKESARANDHDLVAEVGAVEPAKKDVAPPPDRTADVVARLG